MRPDFSEADRIHKVSFRGARIVRELCIPEVVMSKEDGSNQAKKGFSRRIFLRNSAIVAASVPLASLVLASNARSAEATKKAVVKAKSLMIERSNCTGCHSCVFACSLFHEQQVRPSTARIHIRRYNGLVDVPIICWHCVDAPCVAACPVTPTKAIEKNKEINAVQFTDEKRCLGASCNKCIAACPAQYLRSHPDTGKPIFCDLCGGEPQCVAACARQSNETGETLRWDSLIGGVHWSYRDVTPQEAADGLMLKLFYPNKNGERR